MGKGVPREATILLMPGSFMRQVDPRIVVAVQLSTLKAALDGMRAYPDAHQAIFSTHSARMQAKHICSQAGKVFVGFTKGNSNDVRETFALQQDVARLAAYVMHSGFGILAANPADIDNVSSVQTPAWVDGAWPRVQSVKGQMKVIVTQKALDNLRTEPIPEPRSLPWDASGSAKSR